LPVLTLWSPVFFVTLIWAAFFSSPHRWAIAGPLMGLPFLVLYVVAFALGSTGACIWMCLATRWTVYRSLGWRWVVRLPSYRRADPFQRSKLCRNCQSMLKQSGLLFGTWAVFTSVVESHRWAFTDRDCELCAMLAYLAGSSLAQRPNESSRSNERTPLLGLEEQGREIQIRSEVFKNGDLSGERTTSCVVQLNGQSKEMRMGECRSCR
jgi:hypothetical protein